MKTSGALRTELGTRRRQDQPRRRGLADRLHVARAFDRPCRLAVASLDRAGAPRPARRWLSSAYAFYFALRAVAGALRKGVRYA